MDLETIKISGQIAGIGGIAISLVTLLYRDFIAKNVFSRLNEAQSYSLLKLFLVLSWSIAMTGIVAWVYVSVSPAPLNVKTDLYEKIFKNPLQ